MGGNDALGVLLQLSILRGRLLEWAAILDNEPEARQRALRAANVLGIRPELAANKGAGNRQR